MGSNHVYRVSIEGELTIYTAVEWREKLLVAFTKALDLELDLSRVAEIDSAGLQLLIAAKIEAEAQQKNFYLLQHSQVVRDLLEFFRLEGFFGDPVLIPAACS